MSTATLRIAVIDIGSNTIKLLVTDFRDKTLDATVHYQSDETRLGGFLGQGDRVMPKASIDAGTRSVEKLHQVALTYQPDEIAIVATSAVREAENKAEFCDAIFKCTGLSVTLLSGREEAEAIARGARCDPELQFLNSFYMIDQGGGSLEMIHWSPERTSLASLPLGAVRLFRKFQQNDNGPLSQTSRSEIVQWVDEQWSSVEWLPLPDKSPWIATGGALTFVRLLLAERNHVPFEQSSNRLSLQSLQEVFNEIADMTVEERISIAKIPESRADILPAGLLAILRIMELAQVDTLRNSIYNLRYGYAAKLASKGI